MSYWYTSSEIGDALRKIQNRVTCEECSQTFRDPRLLDCLHVYCQECLDGLLVLGPPPNLLTCPSCRRRTRLGASGVAGLPPAFHIHSLLRLLGVVEKVAGESGDDIVRCGKCGQDAAAAFCLSCWQYVCGECLEIHKRWRELASHELASISDLRNNPLELLLPRSRKKAPLCPVHANRELGVYCETCEELACLKCLSREGHRGHEYALVDDLFEPQRRLVEEAAKTFRSGLAEVDEAILRFPPRLKEISDRRADLEEQIRKTMREMHGDLELRRQEFQAQVRQIAQQKLKTLESQRQDAETVRLDIERTLCFADRYLRAGKEREVVAISAMIAKHVNEILAGLKDKSFAPLERADVVFRPSGLADMCAPSEKAVRCTRVSPSHSRIVADPSGVVLGPARSKIVILTCGAGDAAVFTVSVKDENGEDFLEPVEVTATLTVQGSAAECAIGKEGVGRYSVRCLPGITGRGILHVRINAESVGGGPVPVVVKDASSKQEDPVAIVCGLKRPHGVAVSSRGQLLIVERGCCKISIFSPYGTGVKTFGSFGSAPGQFNDPDGVTVDSSDNILVVDSGNHRIQKFTAEGEFITAVGSKGDGPLQFNLPTNVKIHPQTGNMYVCDQYNHRIQIMKEDFSFVGTFGREGIQDGDLLHPTDLAFDSSGTVHVVDSGNKRIQVFTRSGRCLGQYRDKEVAETLSPYSICADVSSGRVYVGEYTHCVSAFTCLGSYIASLGKKGTRPGDFAGPCRIVTHMGLIFVSDCSAGQLKVFLDTCM